MKKVIRFIAVALLFLLCFSYTSVLAGDKPTIEDIVDITDDFEGTITFNNKNAQVGAPEVYHGLAGTEAGAYMVYDISFEGNGKKGTAFCVFPHLSAGTTNKVRCGKVTPQAFPRTYYAAYTYWNEIKGNHKLADFVMRSVGILDKDAGLNEKRQKFCEGKD